MTTNPPEQTPEQGPAVPPPAPGYAAPAPAAPLTDAEQRQWAMFAHLGGILFGFVPALVIWLIQKERGRFVEEQSKEALNFQITWNVALIISYLLIVLFIGMLLAPVVYIGGVILMVLAGVAANKGEAYRYPVNVRLIK